MILTIPIINGNKQPAATTEKPGSYEEDDYATRDEGVAYPLYYYRYVNSAGANDEDYHTVAGESGE